MSVKFQYLTKKINLLFIFLWFYGICYGHKGSNGALIKKYFCYIYSTILVIYITFIAHFLMDSKFIIDADADSMVDWMLRLSITISIPVQLKYGEKYREILTKMLSKLSVKYLRLQEDITFIKCYMCFIIIDISVWYYLYFEVNFFLTLYQYIEEGFEGKVHAFTYIKCGILVRILENSVLKFNSELMNLIYPIEIVKGENNARDVVAKLIHLRGVLPELLENAKDIIQIIQVPVLVLLFTDLICVANLGYWFIKSIEDKNQYEEYVDLLYIVDIIINIAYFLNTCSKLDNQVCRKANNYINRNF